jgi:ribosomal protein L9
MINKEKNKDKAQKEKRKINLKQMKNVYKVFFNQNIMFNKKQNKNPKIFESIKEKDEVHDYVFNQSQMKLKSQSGFFSTPNDQ